MTKQYEIRLSGSGGQGLILGGIILAEAALIDGKNCVQSQSYGPEARGGASKAEVIISEDEIHYPKVKECDILLSLTQKACDMYCQSLKNNGILIIDDGVTPPENKNIYIYKVPIIKTAIDEIQNPMVANIIALGVLNEVAKIVSKESLLKAVKRRVPRGTEELNEKALGKGVLLAKNIHKG